MATIPYNVPFLDSLACWWLARQGADQLAIADGIFIVPTRRAARGLTDAFLRQADGAPLLLPRVLALGGLDEVPLTLAGALDMPPAIQPHRRLAILTRLVLALAGRHGAPRTAERAWQLAAALADLLDEAARAEIDLAAKLPSLVAEDFATHWGVTLEFLQIVTQAWPAILAGSGAADVAASGIALLNAQTALWETAPPGVPVIAAGTTGAIPAVARLLRTVARLPEGLVVLPGLDLDLDEQTWASLANHPGHPQASLWHLLKSLDATRGDVRLFAPFPEAAPASRVTLLRQALLPAAALHHWRTPGTLDATGITLLTPADQQEEAASIALILRAALEHPSARAALVTPDRVLAQRVAAELQRFGVTADDSAGEPLADTPPAVFLRLLAQAAAAQLAPVALLSVLKHPLAAAGLAPAACRAAARALELAGLRGPAPAQGLAGLRATKADGAFLDRLENCLAPLAALPPLASPDAQLRALLQAAEALAGTDSAPGAELLWRGEEGEALAETAATLLDAFADLPPQPLDGMGGLLDAALAGIAIRTRRALRGRTGGEHPRVFIWGLLEARLQAADTIVLGGLTEASWPALAESGPWMNRAMRAKAGLPDPEQAVGLAAHDFCAAACAARNVVLSAAKRRDGAPAVPARWLVRLEALLAGTGQAPARHPAAAWAGLLDRPAGPPRPVRPPAPTPPVARRPRRLRVTDIETWLRDPYAIHARHVLGLKKLDPLEQSADAADYGQIVHAGLQNFYTRHGTTWPPRAGAALAAAMDDALNQASLRPALAAWWRPRLHRIAAWVAEAEADRRARLGPLALIKPEVEGRWIFDAPAGPFSLVGRADRIERLHTGDIAILDYKTGTLPSTKDVEEGRAPQLCLEAAMAAAGAFGPELQGRALELTYWRVSGGHTPGESKLLFRGKPEVVEAHAGQAATALMELVASFDQPGRAYLSQPHPGAAPRFSDYAQLARVAEWAAVDDT